MSTHYVTRLLVVRHGESKVTVDRVVGGPETCTGLSELGREQTRALAARFAAGHEPVIDALYASTLPRAIETAEILRPAVGDLDITLVEDLEEQRPGQSDGVPFEQFTEVFGDPGHRGRPHLPFAPGAESHLDFFHRTETALQQVLTDNVGRTILVACHGGVIDIAFRVLLDLPRRGHFELWTLNTSITEFVVDDTQPKRGPWRLVRYNDAAHLAGLPRETARP